MTFKYIWSCFAICAVVASTHAFKLGSEQTFTLINDVSLHDLKTADKPILYRISGALKVGTIWGSDDNGFLLRFELESAQLYLQKPKVDPVDFDEKSSILSSYKKTKFYAFWREGTIEKIFLPETKDESFDNFVRSVLSLFQYRPSESEEPFEEYDISGRCNVKYSLRSSTKIMKYKTECFSDFESYDRLEKPLGATDRFARVNVITLTADGHLESVHSSDHHKFEVNAYPNVGFSIGSIFFIRAEGAEVETKTVEGKNLEEIVKKLKNYDESTLLPVGKFGDVGEEKKLVSLIKDVKSNLQDDKVGKGPSAQVLLNLLPAGRLAKTEEFTRIINARSTKEIRGQLMDFLGAVHTEASHEAFRKTLNFTNEEDFDDIERYLQALAVGVKPEESIIRDLFSILTSDELENEKLRDTLVQSVASMAYRFANKLDQDFKKHVVVEVKNFLMKSLNKCETNDCKVVFIRGLQNLQSPDTVEKLLSLALNFPYKISVAAMKALRKFPATDFAPEAKAKLFGIFFQRGKKFDSSARTIALDILLTFPLTTDDVAELVSFLKSNDSAYEIKQYLIQKLRMSAEKCSQFNEMLRLSLSREPLVNNWNVYGGVKGLSTVLERGFSQQPSFNGSLMSVQEMKGGALKRGHVDLLMGKGEDQTCLFTLGIFAGGLSSFISSSDAPDPDEDSTATAGMELAIQGVHLRPLTFFNGQGELMGHVWSGTASTPTTAYKGVTLLQDHKKVISLNNGALLDFSALGAVSIDLNGKIEISLWYKNANSEVVQNTGTALKTTIAVRSSIVQLTIETDLLEEPQINLSSKIDFSDQTAICMQLSQPNTQLLQTITKSIRLPNQKKPDVFKHLTKLRYNLPGYTHVLNRKNTEMCNKILTD